MAKWECSPLLVSLQQTWLKGVWILLLLVAAAGLPQLQVQPSIQAYFAKDDPQVLALQQFEDEHAPAANLLLLLSSDTSWKNRAQYLAAQQAVDQLLLVEGVEAINPFTLLGLNNTLPPAIAKQFVSEDGKSINLAINVDTNVAGKAKALQQFFTSLDSQLSRLSQQAENSYTYLYAGELALSRQYLAVLRHDLAWFVPALLFSFAVLFVLVIRQARWLLGMVSCAVLSLTISLGVAAWLGLKLAAISAFLPLVIISLAMAYSSHLFFAWRGLLCTKSGEAISSAQAMLLALQHKLAPLFWGAVTTAVGFLLLCFSPSPPIADFGVIVAFAVMINALACYSILPLWVNKIGAENLIKQAAKANDSSFYTRLLAHRKVLLLGVTLLSSVALLSVKNLAFDDDSLGYFSDDNAFSQSRDQLQQQFLGMHSLRYQILDDEASEPLTVADDLSRILSYLAKQDEVRQVNSAQDWLDWIAQDPSALAKLMAMPQSDGLSQQKALLNVWLAPLSNRQLIAFEQRVAEWAASQQIQLSAAYSSQLIFAKFNRVNGQAMLLSFAVALLLVALVVLVLRRSVYLMLLALLANGLPLLWVFALWQWSGQHLSLGSAVVMGMMLGIIVDDSLHILLKVHPANSVSDLQQRMESISPALLLTSGALLVGFSLGGLSDFLPIQQMSLLSGLSLAIALLFDLVLLPLCLPLKSKVNAKVNTAIEQVGGH
ncbi:RND transporter [Agarivorans sp. Toyoura001]|uniref:efflux RND transporter permease subunit n=1 Tax=Agarivorans sp. Toyoura001 TaxID=2283141 RepID=UPI0010EE2E2F|nr:MMPL family transporter [Agarivorans sp. Toyoura001]GDY25032.1 RND transporter [Agarivorans sp. Toyoura001]